MSSLVKRTFISLEVPGYRLMWLADIGLNWAEFMEIIILSWFVLGRTDSPLILGLFGALRFTGTLVAPFFGVFVDRFGRKKIFLASRASFFILSFSVLILTLSGALTVTFVLVLASLVGICRSMDMIVRQSVLPEVVGESKLHNGVALSRTGRDATQIIGPICGGMLLEQVGTAYSYIVIVLLYASSFLLIAAVKGLPSSPAKVQKSVLLDLTEGLRYVKTDRLIMGLLVVAFIVNFTAFPLNNTLITVVARDVMLTGATRLGLLMGAYSLGSLLGSLTIGAISEMGSAGRMMMVGSVVWHLGILAVAYMKWFYPALPVLVLIGISQSFSMVTMALMILKYTSKQMRGRVLGLRQLAVYGLPLGLLLSGVIADKSGVSVALLVNGVMGLVLLGLSIFCWSDMLSKRKD